MGRGGGGVQEPLSLAPRVRKAAPHCICHQGLWSLGNLCPRCTNHACTISGYESKVVEGRSPPPRPPLLILSLLLLLCIIVKVQ